MFNIGDKVKANPDPDSNKADGYPTGLGKVIGYWVEPGMYEDICDAANVSTKLSSVPFPYIVCVDGVPGIYAEDELSAA